MFDSRLLQKNAIKNLSLNISYELIQVLEKEAQSINYLIKNFPINAEFLVEKILHTYLKANSRVIFTGMGKSGHVARKLVATFSGLNLPAFFLHPAEALHGDLGVIMPSDLIIAISKSATGIELEQIMPVLKSQGNFICLICCANGNLNFLSDLVIKLPFQQEACFLNLAPTSSSTLCMAFGDALAVVCAKLKGFNRNDFAKIHPSGALGKKLLLSVESLMYKDNDLPLVSCDTNLKDLLFTITNKKMGIAIVIDSEKNLLGIITDGDLRRAFDLGPDIFNKTAEDLMIVNPKTIKKDILAALALQTMEEFNITSLVVVQNKKKVVGLIHIHDLVKAGL
ncbi:KpsF/GutQ family sugar-phosphate isomerase [Candidatus Babeliales bacterium]|nr:KpsF/GutQ family sugar-phosphate isomerase [Candidatus Babeliales bacterium]MCF7899659.1 KpsF/GutQ family sugar-phosphate isomerase [Candidatus Babeliales bacterium]